jgi:thymidylate synthase (FAD)
MKPIKAKDLLELDKNLQVKVLQCYPIPEQVIYQAAKCDYSETPIHEREIPSPSDCGKWVVDTLFKSSHFGPLEHPSITFSVAGYVHSVMVQGRTHRIGNTWDCQSSREEEHRQRKLGRILSECEEYSDYYSKGMAEEHIRDYLPQAIRQNFVVSFNLRSVLHFLDMRSKLDAQLEIQALCLQFADHLSEWSPNVWKYYEETRLYKGKISP